MSASVDYKSAGVDIEAGNEAVRRIKKENEDAQVTGVAADLGTKEGVDLLTRTLPALDILVDNLPHATFMGADAQLDAAVNHLKDLIAKDPRPVPPKPVASVPTSSCTRASTSRPATSRCRGVWAMVI